MMPAGTPRLVLAASKKAIPLGLPINCMFEGVTTVPLKKSITISSAV